MRAPTPWWVLFRMPESGARVWLAGPFIDFDGEAEECPNCDGTGDCTCACGDEHDCHTCGGTGVAPVEGKALDEVPEFRGYDRAQAVAGRFKLLGFEVLDTYHGPESWAQEKAQRAEVAEKAA